MLSPSPSLLFSLSLSRSLSSPQLKDFIQTSSGGGAVAAFARAVEMVEANVKWHRLYERQFYQWLRKSPNG